MIPTILPIYPIQQALLPLNPGKQNVKQGWTNVGSLNNNNKIGMTCYLLTNIGQAWTGKTGQGAAPGLCLPPTPGTTGLTNLCPAL